MPKNWYDFTPEDDERLYSEDFNLMEELGITSSDPDPLEEGLSPSFEELEQLEPQNQQRSNDEDEQGMSLVMLQHEEPVKSSTDPDQTSGPSEKVGQTFLTLEELEREELGPQNYKRSKEEDEQGMALVISQLEMAHKAARALDTKEKHLLQELEDLRKLRERDREQHQEEKLKLLKKTKMIILDHNTQMERKDRTTQELQTELDKVKEQNGLLLRESEELKCVIQLKDGQINQLMEKQEEDKLKTLKKTKLIIEAHNSQMERKDRTIQDLQTDLDQVKEERRALRDRSDEQKHQLLTKDGDIEMLQKQVEDMKQMLEEIREDSCQKSKEWDTEKRSFFQNTADLTFKLQEKSLENTQLMEQYSELERALSKLKSDMSALVQFYNELEVEQKEEAEQKVQMLQQIQGKEAQVRKTEEEKDAIWKTCEELKEVLKKSEGERSLLEERANALDQEVRSAEVERSLLIERNNVLQQQVEQEKQIQTELQDEKTAVLKTCKELREERSLQVERCSVLEKKLKTTEEQRSLLEEMSRALEQELEKKRRKWYRRLLRV